MQAVPMAIHEGDRTPSVLVIQYWTAIALRGRDDYGELVSSMGFDGVAGTGTFRAVSEAVGKPVSVIDSKVQAKLIKEAGGPLTPDHIYGASRSKLWPDLFFALIGAIISRIEVGDVRDAYGYVEGDIGDGAGTNYGPWCSNRNGSIQDQLKHFDGDIDDLLHTTAGTKRQNQWFRHRVIEKARDTISGLPFQIPSKVDDMAYSYADKIGPSCYSVDFRTEALLTLMYSDRIVQGGNPIGIYRVAAPVDVDWWDDTFGDIEGADWHTLQAVSAGGTPRGINSRMAQQFARAWAHDDEHDPVKLCLGLGTLRAWSSRPRYRRAVWSRVKMICTGHGVIHKTAYDLPSQYALEMW